MITAKLENTVPNQLRGVTSTLSRNVAASLVRVAANSLIALALPAYLTHHLPVTTYGAWVLVLQLAAYVTFLDIGVQTGVAKFVAEYEATGDEAGAGRHASVGLVIMSAIALAGCGLTFALASQVPRLFHNMPAELYRDVRISLVLVGLSSCFGLVCSVFAAIFTGLQRYSIPMAISVANRLAFALAVIVAVKLQGSLAVMGAVVATVNVVTALAQVVAWRRLGSHIRVSFRLVDASTLKKVMRYCFMLAIWSVGMLCVTGLDITLVGHYSYDQTAYYSVATLPTTFMLVILSSVLNPLMPASSALSMQRSATEMGGILTRVTRYSTLLLLLTGLPLIVCGFPILKLWVGPLYALHSLTYLRILILANILRSLCGPYATLLIATGKMEAATTAAVLEAVVNLGSSIYLASRFGAIGVALGTLIGSTVSVSLHFAVSMHRSRGALSVSRSRLFVRGLLQPALVALPSLILFPAWWSSAQERLNVPMTIVWGLSTLAAAWYGSLVAEDRRKLEHLVRSRLGLRLAAG